MILVICMYRRLRDLREDKDLTQREVAVFLGMSQTGYSKYETGENDIPTNILRKLARFHKTSTDYILELTNEAMPYVHAGKKCGQVNISSHRNKKAGTTRNENR